jgi:hypothetical protein
LKLKYSVFALVVVLSMVLGASAPLALAADPVPAPQLPGGLTVSQAYIDVVTYWYKQTEPKTWETKLAWALNPTGTNGAPSVHVILTGVPANAWWIDAYRLEFDGTWTNSGAGWSFHTVGQAPNPVHGNLMLQGHLPEAYVIRVCDRSGAMIAGGLKLLLVTRTAGDAVTFDVPGLPAPLAEQIATLKM